MADRPEIDIELDRLATMAPQGFCINLQIRYVTPLLHFTTHSPEWIAHYHENGFPLRDPTIGWAMSVEGAYRWSQMPVPDPYGFFEEAASFGLNFGLTVSCGPVTSRTIASFCRRDREFSDDEISELSAQVTRLHDMARPIERLTAAQIEALRAVAAGNRHSAAAAKLNISESAFKARLISARKRLSARTTAEALQRASDHGLI